MISEEYFPAMTKCLSCHIKQAQHILLYLFPGFNSVFALLVICSDTVENVCYIILKEHTKETAMQGPMFNSCHGLLKHNTI